MPSLFEHGDMVRVILYITAVPASGGDERADDAPAAGGGTRAARAPARPRRAAGRAHCSLAPSSTVHVAQPEGGSIEAEERGDILAASSGLGALAACLIIYGSGTSWSCLKA